MVKHPTNGGRDELHDYQYTGPSTAGTDEGALWDWDYNPATNHNTFSTWRGFPKVRTVDGTGTQTITDRWYYTGLGGHPTSSTGSGARVSHIVTSHENVYDDSRFMGRLIRETSNNTAGADLVSTWHDYTYANTVTGTVAGFRRETDTITSTYISGTTTPRLRRIVSDYDLNATTGNGKLVSSYDIGEVVESAGVLVAATSLNACTTYAYAKNTTTWVVDTPSDVQLHDGACTIATLLARTQTFYDASSTLGSVTKGNPTKTLTYRDATNSNETGATYDSNGRVLSSYDKPAATASTTTITYTPADKCVAGTTGGSCRQPDSITTTSPLGDVSISSNFDWARGAALTQKDPNDKVSTLELDTLGRTVSRTAPTDVPACPTEKWTYTLSNAVPLRVLHQQLKSATISGTSCTSPIYVSDYTFADSAGRTIQTQRAAPSGPGVTFTWQDYDNRGLPSTATDSYFKDPATLGTYLTPIVTNTDPFTYTVTQYDELARPTDVVTKSGTTELWRTQSTYLGDSVLTTPPASADLGQTKTWIDVYGRTWRTDEYESNGGPQVRTTKLTFNRHGDVTTLTDPLPRDTTTTYDWLGAPKTVSDPNSGSRTLTYDDAGNLLTVLRNGVTLTYTVDKQHRVRVITETVGTAAPRTLRLWRYGEGSASDIAALKPLNQVGRVMTANSYDAGNNITAVKTEYDAKGRTTKSTTSIPGYLDDLPGTTAKVVPTLLQGDWVTTIGYDRADQPTSQTYPFKSSTLLPAETLTTTYDSNGLPSTLGIAGGSNLISDHTWTGDGHLWRRYYNNGGSSYYYRSYSYDPQVTSRLAGRSIVKVTGTTSVTQQNENFTYDAVGNPLSTLTVGQASGQYQCYDYDQRARLTRAFTASASCSTAPAPVTSSGNDYNITYTYDLKRNALASVTDARSTGTTSKTYAYSNTTTRPEHAPQTITTSGVVSPDTLTYNTVGELTARTGNGAPTHTWDNLGQLRSSSIGTNNSWNIYDASGNRVLRRTTNGSTTTTTLTVAGQEIEVNSAGTAARATRAYTIGGAAVATKVYAGTTGTLHWTFNDRANSAEVTINAGEHRHRHNTALHALRRPASSGTVRIRRRTSSIRPTTPRPGYCTSARGITIPSTGFS